ncbi:MAG: DAK2 domain-containing protein [Selenomonas sp.]|uniref:dihydroxyacetone kinase family protein n=1 Tax=Selenomonas sp. TaxID=2053611 RepID=UPI0025E9D378|nr:dihydroxyacetone kinase subunit L [Selenomonas sp.]MCR5757329.1 DAK2 domain-containing protein [Selenomonas sp.]
MKEKITLAEIPELFTAVAEIFSAKKDMLCEMDANMGDGDLGLTMEKGYGALPELLRANVGEGDIGKMLMKSGMKMATVVPSTMGTLMASGVMEGGKALKGKTELSGADLTVYLTGFAAGIAKRGKCQLGDRTVLDAVDAGAKKAEAALQANPDASLADIIAAAVTGAEAGVEATKEMIPKFGKAAVFSAKAKGVADQGAVAGLTMIRGLQNYICA